MGYPLGQWGSAVPAVCPFNSSCTPHPHHWWGGVRSRKGLDCASAAQQWLKHLCIIKAVSNTNPKHGHIPSTVKKTSSTQPKQHKELTQFWSLLHLYLIPSIFVVHCASLQTYHITNWKIGNSLLQLKTTRVGQNKRRMYRISNCML